MTFGQWIGYKLEWDLIMWAAGTAVILLVALMTHAAFTLDRNEGKGIRRFFRRLVGSSQLDFEEALERERKRRAIK